MIFYLGTHQPHWLARTDVPLFVSARRLRGRRGLPRALGPWALDSGGFSELSLYGEWRTPAMQYSSEVRDWAQRIGNLQWAAAMDWMCEPFIVAKTGFTVAEHQRRTVANYLLLRQLAPDLPWLPVIQGYTLMEYRDCIFRYADAGVCLTALPVVGLGSVCRRQDTAEAESIVHFVKGWGIRIHGFGFKLGGIKRVHHLLESADSLAWSFAARRSPPLPGCVGHKNCANCLRYALAWRERVVAMRSPGQLALYFPEGV